MRKNEYAFKSLDEKTCIFQGIKIYEIYSHRLGQKLIGTLSAKTAAQQDICPEFIRGKKVIAYGYSNLKG